MGTIIKSSTGKKYELEPRDSGGWKVFRLDSNSNEIVSEENVAESLVSRTKKRLEAGETINFRDIDYTVAKETAVVYLLRDIIHVDEEKRTYSLATDSNDRKVFSSWEIISSNVVLKYMDKSSYSQGTVVPKELYSFFKIQDMDYDEKGKISFYRNNKSHTCKKQKSADRDYIRIFWDSDLKKDIQIEFEEIFQKLPNEQDSNSTFSKGGYLRFEKTNENIQISFSQKTEGIDIIGEIEGVSEGQIFETRKELHYANVHRNIQAGISYQADSIVLSGGYHADEDLGDEIIYTGHGSRDQNTGQQIADQTLTRGNLKLKNHCIEGNPIRVTRGSGGDPKHSPSHGYRYDGLYRIDSFWEDVGSEGFKIYRYRLVKLNNIKFNSKTTTHSSTQGSENPKREQVTTSRVIRNSKVGREVKQMYDHTCQISAVRLETPTKPYAEACHIKPLGLHHKGPDIKSNVLCLSPNMHVLFDYGAIAINDDLTLLGMEGNLYVKPEHELIKRND
jgi:putative restriction endonuclease